jgi:hypothetical protein
MKTLVEIKETLVQILDAEIQTRKELLDKMVGQLYPSIVNDELYKLRLLKEKIK